MINLVSVLRQSFEILNNRHVLALSEKDNNISLFRLESVKFPVVRVIKAQLFFSYFSLSFYSILGVVKVKWVVIVLLSFYVLKPLSLPFSVLASIQSP